MSTLLRTALAALLALVPLTAAEAQTTHTVQLFTVSFSPNDLTIQEGDTVRWQWVTGFHDVKSGENWIADGIFNSGSPVPAPNTFQVTFDAAFLQANPMPGNVYEYMCQLHTPVMKGVIRVQSPSFHGGVLPYGTAISAPGSLALLSGLPKVGQSFTVGARNTAIATSAPAATFLLVSSDHWDWWPVGQVLPGFGLNGFGDGELLISLAPPNPLAVLGPVTWGGGTSPAAPFDLPVPNLPALVGVGIYLQAALLETAGGKIGLTNALQVVIGQ